MTEALERMLDEVAEVRWDQRYPELGAGPIPVEPYVSPEYFEAEKAVFRRTWLNVARVEEFPRPGDYRVIDVEFLGQSIILTRGQDGEVYATHNVCSHRGNRMLWDEHGNRKRLVCRYHGWTYDLDGAINYIPDEQAFDFPGDRSCLNLTPVHVGVWEGFVFINLAEQPPQTLTEFLAPMDGLHGYPFDEVSGDSYWWSFELPANWKLVRDAFLETYHVRYVHGLSIPKSSWGTHNPFSHCLDYEVLGQHSRYAVAANPEYVPAFMGAKSFEPAGGFLDFEPPEGVNRLRHPLWLQDANVMFPNFICDPSMATLFGSYYTYNFWPITVDRTRFVAKSYFPKAKTAGQRAAQEYGKVLLREALLEDCQLIGQQQVAVASGVKKEWHLNASEVLIRHANVVMDEAIRSAHKGASDHV